MLVAYYGPCGAAIAGGLYTLNCDSVGGDGGSGCGTVASAPAAAAAAAGVVGSVLEGLSIGVGAVDARVGEDRAGLLLGVDICRSGTRIGCVTVDGKRQNRLPRPEPPPFFFPFSFRRAHVLVDMMTSSSRTHIPRATLHKEQAFGCLSPRAPRGSLLARLA